MKKFAIELAEFLRRYYPEANHDGTYRFSADIEIRGGEVDVEIPILTRLPDPKPRSQILAGLKDDPLATHLPYEAET